MKYIIIGMHSSGKQEVVDLLESRDIRCGKLFTNLDNVTASSVYNGSNYELYTHEDILSVFENNAYIFMQEFPFGDLINVNSAGQFEGLSLYEFENNDVFVMSPDKLFSISPANVKEEVCFVWLDNTKSERLKRYHTERRTYSFSNREEIEHKDADSFVKYLYSFENSRVLYFTNEDPARVAAVIYSLIKHPDLIDIFTESFN